MIIGSHNSWSYLPPKKWWMKIISFTGRCQNKDIIEQYNLGARCFDLRIRFKDNKFILAHGIIEYDINKSSLFYDLYYLNSQKDKVYIRILHECRTKKQYTEESINNFIGFVIELQRRFTNLIFFGGNNLYNYEQDYKFSYTPICEGKYSSVCSPIIIDDWWPWLYAVINNKKIKNVNGDILLIDFIQYYNLEL